MFSPILACLLALPAPAIGEDRPPSPEVLRAQATRCRALLKSSLVDFYLPANVDKANGGYHEILKNGEFAGSGEKFLVMQARQLWFFSTLAIEGIEKAASLSAARAGFTFLESKMRDRENGGYFAKVSNAGTPTDRRKHAYLNAFALYALVAYHRASGDASALVAAKDLFRLLDAKSHDARSGGYHEFFREDWTPIIDPAEPIFVGAVGTKTYNTHLHLLEAFTALYREWPVPPVRDRLNELIVILTTTVRHPSFFCNVDAWSPDWRIVNTPANLRASYGHDIECAWLVLDAADALGLPRATFRNWADALCQYSLKYGYDLKNGGFFYTGPLGLPSDDTKKEWWVQAEALPAMLTMYRETGNPAYFDAFSGTLAFLEKHGIAPRGGWYRARTADGSSLDDMLSSPWQCAYHDGRALIVAAKLLEEIARGAR